jgi:hypothetical protein
MASYWGGTGGHWKLGAAVVIPVGEWRIRRRARLADATVSTSTGETRASVMRGGQGSAQLIWDSDATPESLGLREGAQVNDARFLFGGSPWMLQVAIIIEDVEYVSVANMNADLIRANVTFYVQGAVPDPVLAA